MWRIFFLLTFLLVFFLFVKPLTDPDLFWHLRYGEEILKTHRFPYEDQFSFTFSGYHWADSYWLSEVLIYLLVSKTGFFFPALFFAALGAGAYLAVGFWAPIKKVSIGSVSGAVFLGAITSWQIFGVRPQVISIVFLALVFIILHRFWKNLRPKLLFLLPIIFLLWANSHAGFMLGLVLIWLFWGLEFGRFLLKKLFPQTRIESPYLNRRQLKILVGINIFSTLVTLINPYGITLWRAVLNDAASARIKNLIVEWQAPDFHSELGLFFFFFLLVLAGVVYLGRVRIHPTRFIILLSFCLLALAAVRHIAVFALLATPFLAESLTVLPWKKIDFPQKNLASLLFLMLFTFGWALEIVPPTYRASQSIKNLARSGGYPYEAVEYLRRNPQERILSNYEWGGYLIWQLPEGKTFVDGRMPGWKNEGREILDDYDKIVNLKKEAPELLDFWQIKAFLIPPDLSLTQYLKIHPDWEKRYEDKTAVIFVRKVVK